ncbi:MAG TPA: hypothetical protein VFA32_23380 [Dehalococcoidia bacterium]|nr:hypothetical protein [Dehalococcoidia bacterium]
MTHSTINPHIGDLRRSRAEPRGGPGRGGSEGGAGSQPQDRNNFILLEEIILRLNQRRQRG